MRAEVGASTNHVVVEDVVQKGVDEVIGGVDAELAQHVVAVAASLAAGRVEVDVEGVGVRGRGKAGKCNDASEEQGVHRLLPCP